MENKEKNTQTYTTTYTEKTYTRRSDTKVAAGQGRVVEGSNQVVRARQVVAEEELVGGRKVKTIAMYRAV
jgi:hypothetical protein